MREKILFETNHLFRCTTSFNLFSLVHHLNTLVTLEAKHTKFITFIAIVRKYKNIFMRLFTSAEIPINDCVIKRNKLRKYYNVMRDFCVLFHLIKRLYGVVYGRFTLILYSLHISAFFVERKIIKFQFFSRIALGRVFMEIHTKPKKFKSIRGAVTKLQVHGNVSFSENISLIWFNHS